MSSLPHCMYSAKRERQSSYAPKKQKYPGTSRAIVGVKPWKNPAGPSLCIMDFITDQTVLKNTERYDDETGDKQYHE